VKPNRANCLIGEVAMRFGAALLMSLVVSGHKSTNGLGLNIA